MAEKIAGWHFLEELTLNKSFQDELSDLRKKDEFTRASIVAYLLRKYNIPTKFYDVIAHYIETDKLKPELTSSKVRVVSDNDRTIEPSVDPNEEWRALNSLPRGGVSLRLSHDTRKMDLIKFINNNWESLIEPRLIGTEIVRRGVRNPDRDKEVYLDYMNRRSVNMRAIDIASNHGISESQLYRIIKRQKLALKLNS